MKYFHCIQYQIDGRFSFDSKTLKPISQNSQLISDAFELQIYTLLETIDKDKEVGEWVRASSKGSHRGCAAS